MSAPSPVGVMRGALDLPSQNSHRGPWVLSPRLGLAGLTPGSSRCPSFKQPRRRCCGPPPGHLNNKDSAGPGPAVPTCLPLCLGVPLSLCRALVIKVLGLWFTAEGTEAERAQDLAPSHKPAVVRQDLNSGYLTPKPCSYSSLPHPHQPPGSSTQPRPAQGKRHLSARVSWRVPGHDP